MFVCRHQKGNKCWHRACPGLVVTARAVQNTLWQYLLQGGVVQRPLTAGSGPCGLCILITRAGSKWFYTLKAGMDAGRCIPVHVGSFSRGGRLRESWLRANLTVERETWAVCFSL